MFLAGCRQGPGSPTACRPRCLFRRAGLPSWGGCLGHQGERRLGRGSFVAVPGLVHLGTGCMACRGFAV
eukprot:7392834-Pyramimonas_sp.AAC.1